MNSSGKLNGGFTVGFKTNEKDSFVFRSWTSRLHDEQEKGEVVKHQGRQLLLNVLIGGLIKQRHYKHLVNRHEGDQRFVKSF